MRQFVFLFTLLAVSLMASAVSLISPVSAPLHDGDEMLVGNVGPGQTFSITVDPVETTGGKFGLGGAYDRLSAASLPDGWASVPSKLYAKPLQADITVPKDAPDGEYTVRMALWDEAGGEGLGKDVSFSVQVTVKRDIMGMKVEPPSLSVGAGQPARYTITIYNNGIANDIYTVGSSGVHDWEFRRSVYIPSQTSKTFNYEVVGSEEADYSVKIWARSESSDRISAETPVSLRVNTDLFSDFRAVNKGLLMFPLPSAPVYFIVGLLSNFF